MIADVRRGHHELTPKKWRLPAVNMHAPDHRAQCSSNAFRNADLLWRVSSRKLLSDARLLAIRFEVFAGVFTVLVDSPSNDTAAERNYG